MPQVPPWHTPDEMQQISNLAHWVEGAVLALAALIALAQAAGYLGGPRARYLWPGVVLTAGIFLLGYLLIPHHGLGLTREQWAFVFGDPQQRQHVVLAALAVLGGAAELAYRAGRLDGWGWQLAWPLAAAVIGGMFALHTQHGVHEAVARAVLMHRVLGSLLIATGVLRVAELLWVPRASWLAFAWGLTLLAAAALLVLYREPEGAYRDAAPGDGSAEHGTHSPQPGRPAPARGPNR
jgi:hypothetical protein